MPFTQTETPLPYTPSTYPVFPGAERIFLERELRRIESSISTLNRAVVEIQEYLKTLP